MTFAGVHEQQAGAEGDLFGLERCAFEQQRVIAFAERRDRLVHQATRDADVIVLRAIRDAGDLARRESGRERLRRGDGQRG